MLAISISDIGTAGLIAGIVLIFVFIGLAKGLVRMTFGLVALAAGILAGLWGFQKGASIAGLVISSPDPWMSAVVGAVLGLAVFLVARALFGVLLSPVQVKDGKTKRYPVPGGAIGFIMGAAFAWFVLAGFRYVGTLAELKWIEAATADQTKVEKVPQPLFSKIKRGIDSSAAGKLHEKFDFLNDRASANLAKLSILAKNTVATTSAMKSDKDVRDAILADKINKMLTEQSADLRPYIQDGQYSHLLKSRQIRDTVADINVSTALETIDIEKSLGLIEDKEEGKDKDGDGEGEE